MTIPDPLSVTSNSIYSKLTFLFGYIPLTTGRFIKGTHVTYIADKYVIYYYYYYYNYYYLQLLLGIN